MWSLLAACACASAQDGEPQAAGVEEGKTDAKEVDRVRKDFDWLTTRGAKVLDPEDNERFIIEVGRKSAGLFPDECLVYIDRVFRLLSPGEEAEDSVEAALLYGMIPALLEKAPDRMVAWTKADKERQKLMFLVDGDLISSYAKHVPELVVNQFTGESEIIGGFEMRYGRRALAQALGSLAARDEILAVSKLAAYREERRDYAEIVHRVAESLKGAAFDRAITWLEDNDPTGARDLQVAAFEKSDPEKALAMLIDGSPEGELDRRFSSVMRNWVHREPKMAVAWANGLPDGMLKKAALDSVARSWPDVDRVGAEAWVNGLPEGPLKTLGMLEVIDMLVRKEPEEAFTWIKRLPEGDQAAGYRKLFSYWSRNNPDRVLELLDSSPLTEREKEEVRREARFNPRGSKMRDIARLVGPDPEAALRMIKDLPPGRERDMMQKMTQERLDRDRAERERDPAVHSAMVTKARTDPKEALKMIAGLPDGPDKESLKRLAERALFEKEPQQLVTRMRQLPEGEQRDRELRMYAMRSLRSNPQVALQLAEMYTEQRREREITRVFQFWLRQEPDEAAKALQKSELPEKVKRSLLPSKPSKE